MPIEVTVDVRVVQVVERASKADVVDRKLRWGSKSIALLAPFGQGSEHRVWATKVIGQMKYHSFDLGSTIDIFISRADGSERRQYFG